MNDVPAGERERLKSLRQRLKSGEYDGADVMAAWIAIDELIASPVALVAEQADDWRQRFEAVKLQAQLWKQEARTANATIAEIYQICTGATGEPGNWNGANPVRDALSALAPTSTVVPVSEQAEPTKVTEGWRFLLPGERRWSKPQTEPFDTSRFPEGTSFDRVPPFSAFAPTSTASTESAEPVKPATQRFRDFVIPDDDAPLAEPYSAGVDRMRAEGLYADTVASPPREAPADDAVTLPELPRAPRLTEWNAAEKFAIQAFAREHELNVRSSLADRQSRVPDGQPLFQHYKGGCYRYVCQAKREDDGVLLAVYQSESHEDQYAIYVRPHDEFDAKFTEVAAPKGPSE